MNTVLQMNDEKEINIFHRCKATKESEMNKTLANSLERERERERIVKIINQ